MYIYRNANESDMQSNTINKQNEIVLYVSTWKYIQETFFLS